MFTIISVFLLKFTDCALGTMKTVTLYKGRYVASSVCSSLSAMMFIFVADMMANANGDDKLAIALVVFLANLIGSYIPPRILDRMEADKLIIFVITCASLEHGKEMADHLRELNVPVATSVVYDKHRCKTLMIHAYSRTKDDSRIITANVDVKLGDRYVPIET